MLRRPPLRAAVITVLAVLFAVTRVNRLRPEPRLRGTMERSGERGHGVYEENGSRDDEMGAENGDGREDEAVDAQRASVPEGGARSATGKGRIDMARSMKHPRAASGEKRARLPNPNQRRHQQRILPTYKIPTTAALGA